MKSFRSYVFFQFFLFPVLFAGGPQCWFASKTLGASPEMLPAELPLSLRGGAVRVPLSQSKDIERVPLSLRGGATRAQPHPQTKTLAEGELQGNPLRQAVVAVEQGRDKEAEDLFCSALQQPGATQLVFDFFSWTFRSVQRTPILECFFRAVKQLGNTGMQVIIPILEPYRFAGKASAPTEQVVMFIKFITLAAKTVSELPDEFSNKLPGLRRILSSLFLIDSTEAIEIAAKDCFAVAKLVSEMGLASEMGVVKWSADNLYKCGAPGAKKLAIDLYLSVYALSDSHMLVSVVEEILYDIALSLRAVAAELMRYSEVYFVCNEQALVFPVFAAPKKPGNSEAHLICQQAPRDSRAIAAVEILQNRFVLLCNATAAAREEFYAAAAAESRDYLADDVAPDALYQEVQNKVKMLYREIARRTTKPTMLCRSACGLHDTGVSEIDEIVGYFAQALLMLKRVAGRAECAAEWPATHCAISSAVSELANIETPEALSVITDFVNDPDVAGCKKCCAVRQLHIEGKVEMATDLCATIAQQGDLAWQYGVAQWLANEVQTPRAMDLAADLLVQIAVSDPRRKPAFATILFDIARKLCEDASRLSGDEQRNVLEISEKVRNSAMELADTGAQEGDISAKLSSVGEALSASNAEPAEARPEMARREARPEAARWEVRPEARPKMARWEARREAVTPHVAEQCRWCNVV
jgi:hypothetical protein